jgi:lauroyl/myristoyl acyltransferase
VTIQRTDDAGADDRANAQRLADVFEGIVRRFPEQWMMFDNLWAEGTKSAATMMQTEKATV